MDNRKVIDSFRGEYSIFSNLHECVINFNGIVYQNAEACFQAQKCSTDNERNLFCGISGVEAKRLGRTIKIDVVNWDKIKDYIMFAVVLTKFKQNEQFREKLLSTKGYELIEGNDHGDDYWGVIKSTGKGKNTLGKILMTIRDNCIAEKERAIEISASVIDIPIDTVVNRVRNGWYKYEPPSEVNIEAIADVAMNKYTSKLLRIVAVYDYNDADECTGLTIVEGVDIVHALFKLESIVDEAMYSYFMTVAQMSRKTYEHFKSLNFKF